MHPRDGADKTLAIIQKIAHEVLTSSASKVKLNLGHNWIHLWAAFLQTKNAF